MSSGPSQPPGYSGLNPDQIAMVNKVGYFMSPNAVLPNGQQWQQPAGYSNLNPSQIQAVNEQGFYTNPDAAKPQSLWDKLVSGLGSLASEPKPAIGPTARPGGAQPMGPPPTPTPMLPQGQMAAPPGMGAYFRAQQFPQFPSNNNALMSQYMALQNLMRGS